MKKVVLMLIGLILTACQADSMYFIETQDETSSNVEITIVRPVSTGSTSSTEDKPCQTCSDMLEEGYDFDGNNFCEDSLETWQKFNSKICTNSSPCVLDCEDVFCTWQSPMTSICKACVMSQPYGIPLMQECLTDDI